MQHRQLTKEWSVSTWRWRFAATLALFVAALLSVSRRAHAAGSEGVTVDLYTIGSTPEFPSRFGHSLLCVHEAGKDSVDEGRCYDYGVPDREDLGHVVWTAIRMEPAFIPVTIEEKTVIRFFRKQGRSIERQRLPLNADETAKLVSALEAEVRDHRAYAYHPYWANCATKIRDHIDNATSGRLHGGPKTVPPGSFREYMEQGHGGNADILTVMALYLGEGNDLKPTPWDAMLLPNVLREGVTDRFGIPAEKIDDAVEPYQPGSPGLGRYVVFGLAFALMFLARFLIGRHRLALALKIVGGFLGVFALSLEAVAVTVKWSEISHNWSLALFLPTDLLMPWLSGRRLTLYLKVRVVMAALAAVLEIANVIHQPMLPLAALVAVPMLGILSALREAAARTEKEKSSKASEAVAVSRAA